MGVDIGCLYGRFLTKYTMISESSVQTNVETFRQMLLLYIYGFGPQTHLDFNA